MNLVLEEIPDVWLSLFPQEALSRDVTDHTVSTPSSLQIAARCIVPRLRVAERFPVHYFYEQRSGELLSLRQDTYASTLLLSSYEHLLDDIHESERTKCVYDAPLLNIPISAEDFSRFRAGADLSLPYFQGLTTYIFRAGLAVGRATFLVEQGQVVGTIEKLYQSSLRYIYRKLS